MHCTCTTRIYQCHSVYTEVYILGNDDLEGCHDVRSTTPLVFSNVVLQEQYHSLTKV